MAGNSGVTRWILRKAEGAEKGNALEGPFGTQFRGVRRGVPYGDTFSHMPVNGSAFRRICGLIVAWPMHSTLSP